MSLEAVKQYFSDYHMDHRIMVPETATASVDEAATAHGVDVCKNHRNEGNFI